MNAAASLVIRRTLLRQARSAAAMLPGGSRSVATAVSVCRPSKNRMMVALASHSGPRSFSSSSSSDALLDLLSREHAEEMANETTSMPSELSNLKSSVENAGWKVVDDGAMTKLHKTMADSGLKVQIAFHCQDTIEQEEEAPPPAEEEEEDAAIDFNEEEAPQGVRFIVTATKAGKTLVLNCLSREGQAQIEAAALTTQDPAAVQTASGVAAAQYQGPDFTELAEDLQDAFHEYLEEDVGVDGTVATFVAMYTDYKEQCQYVKFLEDCRGILSSAS